MMLTQRFTWFKPGADPRNLSWGCQAEIEGTPVCARDMKHLTWTRFAPNWEHFCPPGAFYVISPQNGSTFALHLRHLTRFALNQGHFCPPAGALYISSYQIGSTFALQLGHLTLFSPKIGGTLPSSWGTLPQLVGPGPLWPPQWISPWLKLCWTFNPVARDLVLESYGQDRTALLK